eukprot:TRINITY_DN30433_c0_g1_i1.p1 TRINITY_DN30433_c0_g1~~TRINITY_DN30433_c0_g1_i1.p1  ORF type:complete len:355 (-),score=53.68 TRINITY_DN30433_c0_g1_i1:218-1237(-)
MAALVGCQRLASSVFQVSRFGRVDPSHSLLRLGCLSGRDTFEDLALNSVFHCLAAYCGPERTPRSLVDRAAAGHVASSGNVVAIPRWAEVTREQTVLDVFRMTDMDLLRTSAELRCNAAIVVHDAGASDAESSYAHIEKNVLPNLAERRVPVVLASLVETPAHAHGARYAAMSTYGRWQHRYEALVAERIGHIYAVHFFSPQDPRGCFDVLYRAQMSSLYPLGRCLADEVAEAGSSSVKFSRLFLEAAHEIFLACDTDGDGAWLREDWNVFWRNVYGRHLSPAEDEALQNAGLIGASEDHLLRWFESLIVQGRGYSLWACLRAFGYNGALARTSVSVNE